MGRIKYRLSSVPSSLPSSLPLSNRQSNMMYRMPVQRLYHPTMMPTTSTTTTSTTTETRAIGNLFVQFVDAIMTNSSLPGSPRDRFYIKDGANYIGLVGCSKIKNDIKLVKNAGPVRFYFTEKDGWRIRFYPAQYYPAGCRPIEGSIRADQIVGQNGIVTNRLSFVAKSDFGIYMIYLFDGIYVT